MHEVRAWYTIDWANSVFNTLGVSGFLPLLIQSAGLESANFPSVCPNIIRNATAIFNVFPPVPGRANVTSMYYLANFHGLACDTSDDPACVGKYCKGMPLAISDCMEADGATLYPLRILGTSVDPTSFATLCISLSVGAQAVAFILLGAMADLGSMRKRLLLVASLVGGIFSVMCAGACATCPPLHALPPSPPRHNTQGSAHHA